MVKSIEAEQKSILSRVLLLGISQHAFLGTNNVYYW